MRGKIANLQVDVAQLQSTDVSIPRGKVPLRDAHVIVPPPMPNCMPNSTVQREIVLSFNRDIHVDIERDDDNLVKETDEEEFRNKEHGVTQTLKEVLMTDEVIAQVEISLQETSAVGTS